MKFGIGVPTMTMSISESCENWHSGNHTLRNGTNKILQIIFQFFYHICIKFGTRKVQKDFLSDSEPHENRRGKTRHSRV